MRLDFVHPLSLPGVEAVVVYGEEEGTPAGRSDLLAWFKNESDVFGPSRGALAGRGLRVAGTVGGRAGARARARMPPIPRDGPIPGYLECGL